MKELTKILKEIRLNEPVDINSILGSLRPIVLLSVFEYDSELDVEEWMEENNDLPNEVKSKVRQIFKIKSRFHKVVIPSSSSKTFHNLEDYHNMYYFNDGAWGEMLLFY